MLLAAGTTCYPAGVKEADIGFRSIRVVDYHDQLEIAVPRIAGLEELVGRQQAERAAESVAPNGSSERPHRLLLRVEFTSKVNLWTIAQRDAVLFLHSFFCSRK